MTIISKTKPKCWLIWFLWMRTGSSSEQQPPGKAQSIPFAGVQTLPGTLTLAKGRNSYVGREGVPTAPSPRAPLPTELGSAGQPCVSLLKQQGSPCTPEGVMAWVGGRSKGTGKIMFFSNMKMQTESVRGLVRKQISVFEISPCISTLWWGKHYGRRLHAYTAAELSTDLEVNPSCCRAVAN